MFGGDAGNAHLKVFYGRVLSARMHSRFLDSKNVQRVPRKWAASV